MKNVIVVDDDEDIRNLVVSILKLKGFKSSGMADLIASDLDQLPDLIVLDYLLSGKTGIDICRNIRETDSTKDTPVIIMSALADAREKCLSAGANEFMTKPFNVKDLVSCVNKVLEHG